MSAKRFRVESTAKEREEFKSLISRRRRAADMYTHTRILVVSDEAQDDLPVTDEAFAQSLKVGNATMERVRR